MTSKVLSLLLGTLLLVSAGNTNAQEPNVQELTARWSATYNQGDPAALAELYSKDAELTVYYEGRFVGQAAIRAYWAADMGLDSPLTALTVTNFSSDAQGTVIQGHYAVVDRVGGHSLAEGQFLHRWVIEDGEWVLDRDAWIDSRLAENQRKFLQ